MNFFLDECRDAKTESQVEQCWKRRQLRAKKEAVERKMIALGDESRKDVVRYPVRFILADDAADKVDEAVSTLYEMRNLSSVSEFEREVEIPRIIRTLEAERAKISHLRLRRG